MVGGGTYTTTVLALLTEALTKSDNTANDKLMRVAGGPDTVRAMIVAKRLGAIRFYDGERALQSRIAGLTWSQNFSIGDAFYKARNALPMSIRRSLFNRYIEDPYDGASPAALVETLTRLKRSELLSPSSTARLLTIMSNTRTGKNRLRGGLKPGWTLNHKTGTGQVLDGVQAGYNDIGIITAPDGRSYAVAVMIKKTSTFGHRKPRNERRCPAQLLTPSLRGWPQPPGSSAFRGESLRCSYTETSSIRPTALSSSP